MPDPTPSTAAELLARIADLEKENALLRQKIDVLARKIFGVSSEKLDPAQLQLLLAGMEQPPGKAPEPVVAEAPRRSTVPSPPSTKRTPRLPEHLPVIEEIIVPAPVQAAPQDWQRIGEEVSERLDYEPARFLRRRTVRPKYVRRGLLDAAPVIAPLPPAILERSIVAPGLLAQIVVAKYCDHLPLYRQEAIYWTRHQVWLPRQTMAEWVGLAADWLRPIYDHLRAEVTAGGYVQVDETPIRYLSPGHGQTKLGYLWTCKAPQRRRVFSDCADQSGGDGFGKDHSDELPTASSSAMATRPTIALPKAAARKSCWPGAWPTCGANFTTRARRRRKWPGGSSSTSKIFTRWKNNCGSQRAGPRLRQAERARLKVDPVLASAPSWPDPTQKPSAAYLPQSLMGKAIAYALR